MVDTIMPGSLTAESRIWIYQADRFLNDQEISNIYKKLEGLLAQWNTHGKPLSAEAWVEERLFLILAVDESKQYASGCSIDQSTNFIRTIGNRINVDFFNRMNFVYQDESGEPQLVSDKELPKLYEKGEVSDRTLFYDTTLAQKGLWTEEKLKPLADSWHKRFL